jgi:Protein of unknown function (DUF2950)
MSRRRSSLLLPIVAIAAVGALLGSGRSYAAAAAQKHFASPDEAAQALVVAVKAHDRAAMLSVLGTDAEGIIDSGDPVADREGGKRFVSAYETKHALEKTGDAEAVLEVGADRWPLPIPLVKDASGWYFDGEAGEDEIVSRRIGRNELAAIQACLAFVDAEREYYARDPEDSGLLHYAQRFASTPGKRDGLYYATREGEEPSPLGPLFDAANAAGYSLGKRGEPAPYHGYYYRILTGQGAKAPGGAYSYLVGDKLLGGYAMVAYPASYGVSGVMTFLVNHDGVVYEKNLGPETEAKAKAMTVFDLDAKTVRVPDQDEALSDADEAAEE